MTLAYIDTETTGLDPRIHQPYEVCIWREEWEHPNTFGIPHTCSVCGIGITAPPSFGGIPATDMLAAFVVQHSVHRGAKPVGLTTTGRASKAARERLGNAR